MLDSEEDPHRKFLGHGNDKKEPFPLPFALVFAGYSFILLIDRVMFDSHALFEHDHGGEEKEGHGHKHGPEEEPKQKRNSIKIIKPEKP